MPHVVSHIVPYRKRIRLFDFYYFINIIFKVHDSQTGNPLYCHIYCCWYTFHTMSGYNGIGITVRHELTKYECPCLVRLKSRPKRIYVYGKVGCRITDTAAIELAGYDDLWSAGSVCTR